jgi:predicted phosphoribosyltransferase
MRVAIEAVKKAKTGHLVVAVPTGHLDSVEAVSHEADAVYCPNIRSGWRFAVASAYEKWSDVSESEVIHILENVAAKI